MSSFVKLYGSILDSTVWLEDNATRLVWITMLAMADAQGVVEASVPGLANRARVTIEECEHALMRLSSPDRYSRSKDNEGRRIAEVDGGWQLLNHEHYRERRSPGAERVARHRANKRALQCNDVTADPDPDLVVAASPSSVVDLTARSEAIASPIACVPAREGNGPPPAAPPPTALATRTTSPVAGVSVPTPAVTPTRAGRVYVGRLASSSELAEVDLWRREAIALLPAEHRARAVPFSRDIAELGPGVAAALDGYGHAVVRDVVRWAVLEVGAGRMSPRHFRALFNGDSFPQRVVELAAHVAGEAADVHTVSPELAGQIAKARAAVEQNRRTLAIDPRDERAPPPDIRAMVEADLVRCEARLAELLAQSRRPNGAQHAR